MELRDKIAVITGGASGIGRGTARAMAAEGAAVVVADVDETRLGETERELRAMGARALAIRCDVTDDADVDALATRAEEAFGPVDVLMNNAGVAAVTPRVERMTIEEWNDLLDINLLSVVRGVRAFAPRMIDRGSGWIVNTASISGFYVQAWHQVAYSVTKFAVRALTEGLHHQLKPHGVGVSCLAPNGVSTNIGAGARLLGSDDWSLVKPPEGLRVIDADEVGRHVVDGLRDERYLILTHPEEAAEIARRYAGHDAALASHTDFNSVP